MMAFVKVGDLVAGKYRLEREIGSGGMGVVFAAVHVHLEQPVALKFLLAEAAQNDESVERFWREARAAVKVQSEHVARVMDIGRLDSGSPYIVMEYLEGDDLENIVKTGGPLAVHDAVRYVLHACEALAEVHAQGIVHRDIKPANLFLAARANGTRIVKLLDFGISKAAPEWAGDGPRVLTQTSAVIGSPRYMSPEQLRSSRDVDARSDVWALGVTLFELLGGKSPFARGTMPEVCASILKDEPLSLAVERPDVPAGLEAVIRRCLEKSPDARWRNVAELAVALRPFGPLGIIDISVERIVGVLEQAEETARRKAGQPSRPPTPVPAPVQVPAPAPRPTPVRMAAQAPIVDLPLRRRTTSDKTLRGVENNLETHLLAQLGGGERVPRLAMTGPQIALLALDHRAGFVLSCVDGASTIDEILDVSGMPRIDALRILSDLHERGVIACGSP